MKYEVSTVVEVFLVTVKIKELDLLMSMIVHATSITGIRDLQLHFSTCPLYAVQSNKRTNGALQALLPRFSCTLSG